uniref:Metabotropic glutamate receptor 1 n=1 Tax=Rhipicephalus appendiculatus TaxID=34631 RepID=A0A131YLN9_RHIAP
MASIELSRRIFPPPHKNFIQPQALKLRLLQTKTYPSLKMLNIIYPDLYQSNLCPYCGEIASLDHTLWQCTKFAHLHLLEPNTLCGETSTT